MKTPKIEVKRESFTLREIEVLGLIAGGLTNQEISQKLHVSAETVKWYAKQIFPKLGVSNRTQAALKANEIGLLEFGRSLEETPRKLNNLPAQLTSYIGREKDIREIKKLLSGNRLVTLTGPGGIGKTRLALQVANQIQDEYRDGVWLVELAPLEDSAQVMHAIAKVLAIGEREGNSLSRALKNYLSTKNMLLLIDNFEHLLSAAPFVGEVLADAPHISVLATSRERLNVYGELEYQVSPLELPDFQITEAGERLRKYDAVSLFVERAQASKPGYVVDEDQIQAVAKICKLLDGLPLAIELAAPLVKLFSPDQIAKMLETDLDALPNGPRDLPARQRTLRATQEWSYNLLSADEKTLFTNLAVFTGGFTLEAIQAICADQTGGNIINIVTSLVDRNLLNTKEGRDGEIYFSMLETTRQLTKERLIAREDIEHVYYQYAEYYLNVSMLAMREYNSRKQRYWFIKLQLEQNNLRTALVWFKKADSMKFIQMIVALRDYWRHYGYLREGLHWAETALELAKQIPDSLMADALLTAGDYCIELSQDDKAEQYLRKALDIYENIGNKADIARCYAIIGIAMTKSPDVIADGYRWAKKSLEIFTDLNDKSGMAEAHNILGELSRTAEDFSVAEKHYKNSLALTLETGELLREGTLNANLGRLEYKKGDYALAEEYTKKGLRKFLMMDAYYGIYYEIGGLAGAALEMGNPKRAAKLLGMSSGGLDALDALLQYADKSITQQVLVETKRVLNENEFQAAWEEGRKMTVQEAFEYALSEQV